MPGEMYRRVGSIMRIRKLGSGSGKLLLSIIRYSSHLLTIALLSGTAAYGFTPPDTGQSDFFDDSRIIAAPGEDDPYYGQDAQYSGAVPSYQDNLDGTVTDLNTGLMWQQGLPTSTMTWEEAMAGADTCEIGGYDDWRLPTIKELYSLLLFSGTNPGGPGSSEPVPFINTDYFDFEYGDTNTGQRIIDAQYWSSTEYEGLTMMGAHTAFGVNFADGRIKGYGTEMNGPPGQRNEKHSYVRYVRGGSDYGVNDFVDNYDGTVTDRSSGLMWQQSDDGEGRNWEEALAYAEGLELAGHDDWRLPNARELQYIVDYTRSVQATGSAAIDPRFTCTELIDEGGEPNYGWYWTSTTHASAFVGRTAAEAVYIAFGEALGWMSFPFSEGIDLLDVHGSGAQRSDPKSGDPSDYPTGRGPQGDAVRIYNLVRCVR